MDSPYRAVVALRTCHSGHPVGTSDRDEYMIEPGQAVPIDCAESEPMEEGKPWLIRQGLVSDNRAPGGWAGPVNPAAPAIAPPAAPTDNPAPPDPPQAIAPQPAPASDPAPAVTPQAIGPAPTPEAAPEPPPPEPAQEPQEAAPAVATPEPPPAASEPPSSAASEGDPAPEAPTPEQG